MKAKISNAENTSALCGGSMNCSEGGAVAKFCTAPPTGIRSGGVMGKIGNMENINVLSGSGMHCSTCGAVAKFCTALPLHCTTTIKPHNRNLEWLGWWQKPETFFLLYINLHGSDMHCSMRGTVKKFYTASPPYHTTGIGSGGSDGKNLKSKEY